VRELNKFFIGLLVIASIVIIVTTMLMEPKTQGAGSAYGQETNTFGKSAHQSKDYALNRFTVMAGVVFVACLIAILAL